MSELAFFGGAAAVTGEHSELFKWPIITVEDERAVIEVLREGNMSGTDVTKAFEAEFAVWQGTEYALGLCSGTAALHSAMYACGVGYGDEIISPSMTYWATCLPAFSLGATIVFADLKPDSLCLDPDDIEHRITDRTKAIVPVHYGGYPCDMDPIMKIASKHGIKVIEDVSHAQGGLYKGRKVGTIGDAGAMSIMSGKSFAAGEAGILVTDNREIYEKAVAFGHYERFRAEDFESEDLKKIAGLPLGGCKYRMHQLSSAVGRVQLKYYDERCAEIDRAMNYFWDLLEDVPGIKPLRTARGSGSTMAGWYGCKGLYETEELGGLSISRYAEAVNAEGARCGAGEATRPLHLHPLLNEVDVYGRGKPTRVAFCGRDLRQPPGSLPVSEGILSKLITIPWFKKYSPEAIESFAEAYRKPAVNYRELLADDPGDPESFGVLNLSTLR